MTAQAILIDAQFDVQNGQALVDMIKKSGKKLTTVYISAGDPTLLVWSPSWLRSRCQRCWPTSMWLDHINRPKDALSYREPDPGKGAPEEPDRAGIDDGKAT